MSQAHETLRQTLAGRQLAGVELLIEHAARQAAVFEVEAHLSGPYRKYFPYTDIRTPEDTQRGWVVGTDRDPNIGVVSVALTPNKKLWVGKVAFDQSAAAKDVLTPALDLEDLLARMKAEDGVPFLVGRDDPYNKGLYAAIGSVLNRPETIGSYVASFPTLDRLRA
ncbi:MAG TPA: hypothetical protein VLG37_00200 [Candidatus Saccharimonadales bacterium]|nr:hypothetical protein [Candidatus Saccharimonadales bacterium]